MLAEMRAMTPEELRRIRKRLGLTQEKLATKLHVDRRTILRWENGEVPISEKIEAWIKSVLLREG
jgi:transcriptional regulator with XRE-family HTH domain